MVSDNQPVSTEDLKLVTGNVTELEGSVASLNSTVGGIASDLDDLKSSVPIFETLYDGNPENQINLPQPAHDYEALFITVRKTSPSEYISIAMLPKDGVNEYFLDGIEVNINGALVDMPSGYMIVKMAALRLGGGQLLADLLAALGGER